MFDIYGYVINGRTDVHRNVQPEDVVLKRREDFVGGQKDVWE
jgi:hypothetical protein